MNGLLYKIDTVIIDIIILFFLPFFITFRMIAMNVKMTKEKDIKLKIIGNIGAILPLLSLLIIYVIELFLKFAPDLSIITPKWWLRMGLSADLWSTSGLYPGFFTMIIGLIIIIYGAYKRSRITCMEGLYSLIGGYVTVFYFIMLTF